MEMEYRFTAHAVEEMMRRGLSEALVRSVVEAPDQVVESIEDREIRQSVIEMEGKSYLIRVIVERSTPQAIVTVYRTSRIRRYWKDET
jgi:hypothetical protein